MSSKQRVFSHSSEINYNDYIKNKNSVEILKNIKQNKQFVVINKYVNHSDLINYTKAYHNYANANASVNNYNLQATTNLYDSNISFVNNLDHRGDGFDNNFNSISVCDSKCGKSKIYNQCGQELPVLYPESIHYSKNTNNSNAPYLHFNLKMDNWCPGKFNVDYNKIYNSKCININIDGFNGCMNGNECCGGAPIGPTGPKRCCCKKKCKDGLCKNAKPLFYV